MEQNYNFINENISPEKVLGTETIKRDNGDLPDYLSF